MNRGNNNSKPRKGGDKGKTRWGIRCFSPTADVVLPGSQHFTAECQGAKYLEDLSALPSAAACLDQVVMEGKSLKDQALHLSSSPLRGPVIIMTLKDDQNLKKERQERKALLREYEVSNETGKQGHTRHRN